MQRPSPAPGRRPPVLVVQTDDDPGSLARRLGAAPLGHSIDLRRTNSDPIVPEDVEEAARARATANLPERRAAHRARDAELAAEVDAAAAHHHDAAAFADRSAERRKELLDGAFWCEGKRALVLELDTELAGIQDTLDAAARELADAIAAHEALEATQATVADEIEAAHRQLLELEMAGRSEEELRRDLATARQGAEEAATAAAVAERRIAQLLAEIEAAEARAGEVAEELRLLDAALAADPTPVAAALKRLEAAPLVDADPASLRLAADLERLAAELASLPPAPPGPDEADLAAAEQAAAKATAALEELRRPITQAEPPAWWDELTRLHTLVVDAETAAGGGGFGRKAAQRRLEEALAAERLFLAEIGYPTHLDALMSGGRPAGAPRPGLLSMADAEQAAVEAEQHLFELRAAANVAAGHKRLRSDMLRLRSLGGALLGLTPAEVTPERLRQQRTDPAATEAVWEALAAAGIEGRGEGAVAAGQAWLAARSHAGARLVALTTEARAIEEALAEHTRQRPGAESDVAAYAAAATDTRRQVAALESELNHRAEHPLDPAARAAAAAEIRQHIDDLEASNAAARAAAAAAIDAARERHAGAAERRQDAEREASEFRTRAAELARLLDAGSVDDAESPADLGPLASALRAEVTQLDLQVAESGRTVALAAAALAAARAAQAAHQATEPTDPTAADRAAILAELLGVEHRTTDLVVDPAVGLDASGYEVILDELAAAGADRQVVVVTSDARFVAWAIEQPGRLIEVVPAASVDPGPSMTDRIDKAQAPK